MIATTMTPPPGSRTRSLLPFIVAPLVANGQAAAAVETKPQPVEYKSLAGVEYRSRPDTEAITRARAALAAEPRNVSRIIDLGVALSGARQFREAIDTFIRSLELEPNNAQLLRWRGHRYNFRPPLTATE